MIFSSCFTGIESTRKISDKDVAKVVSPVESSYTTIADTAFTRFLDLWQPGKKLYVSDNNFNMLLVPDGYNPDTLLLGGTIVEYLGADESNINGVKNSVVLKLKSNNGNILYYDTSHTHSELQSTQFNHKLPFLIDCDLVDEISKSLVDRQLYVLSSLWVDSLGNSIQGSKYQLVTIKSVEPGNKVYSLKIGFALPDGSVKYMYIALKEDAVSSRMFGNLFSETDPHLLYPQITDTNWELVKAGKLAIGMTKEECQLSIGNPVNIRRVPTYNGLQEYWFYDNGVNLIFVDGILERYRL
ncbi:MAG: hypothetical protein K2J74_02410 [Muribaculaceae bacterium]|nr:hypothetical protein [Muribaculaceae bacterium]